MRQVLTVRQILSRTSIKAQDSSLRSFIISTDRTLSVGQVIVVTNGVVTATVTKAETPSYEV